MRPPHPRFATLARPLPARRGEVERRATHTSSSSPPDLIRWSMLKCNDFSRPNFSPARSPPVARMSGAICGYDLQAFNAIPGFRFRPSGLRNPPIAERARFPGNEKIRKRNAGRRVVHDLYASGAQGAPRRRRLAPPFRFGRARLPAFHHGTCGSDRTPPLSSSSRTSWDGTTEGWVLPTPGRPSTAGDVARRPVVVPAGRFLPGAARERG